MRVSDGRSSCSDHSPFSRRSSVSPSNSRLPRSRTLRAWPRYRNVTSTLGYPIGARYPTRNWSIHMFDDVTVIGAGRAGSTIAARLRERGVTVRDDAELRLLCVPDRAIADVARSIGVGPWVAHVSGGTPLAALDPHERRFSVPPLQ